LNRIILQPCGSADAIAHYVDTIQHPVSIDRIKDFASANETEKLINIYGDRSVAVWGVVPGVKDLNKWKWFKIEPGDVTLFARTGSIFASAVVTNKIHNKDLAKNLWGFDHRGQTWEYIYFLDEIKNHNIEYPEFNKAVGYKPNYIIQGFQILDTDKSQRFFNAFDLESETHQPAPSKEEFEDAVNQLEKHETLDAKGKVNVRVEQNFLRQYLFGDKKIAKCGICNDDFPVSFLVAAHIKKRSLCTLEEKKDYKSVVMPMCAFGCDDLFEKGYVSVKDGRIIRLNTIHLTPAIEEYLENLVGKKCYQWNDENEKYFKWHRQHHSM
jgi:hypothetical protein